MLNVSRPAESAPVFDKVIFCEPLAEKVPDQLPEAVQEVAYVDVQDKFITPDDGAEKMVPVEPFAKRETVGLGFNRGSTFTVTLSFEE